MAQIGYFVVSVKANTGKDLAVFGINSRRASVARRKTAKGLQHRRIHEFLVKLHRKTLNIELTGSFEETVLSTSLRFLATGYSMHMRMMTFLFLKR